MRSYDFVAARTDDGGSLQILNVVDEYTRQCKRSHGARSIGAAQVKRCLDKRPGVRGKAAIIRSDNGREFISETVTPGSRTSTIPWSLPGRDGTARARLH